MAPERSRAIVIVNFAHYHPPAKAVNAEVRAGGSLRWCRWDIRTHRDPDLLDLPADERWVWAVLIGLAGERRADADGARVIDMTPTQLAREADITPSKVAHALEHLRKRGRIRYHATSRKQAASRKVAGGDGVALRVAANHPKGGHVRTDLQTDVPTDTRAAREGTSSIELRTTREGEAAGPFSAQLEELLRKRHLKPMPEVASA